MSAWMLDEDTGDEVVVTARCEFCGESESAVREGVQARTMMRVWQALVSEGMEVARVGRIYCGLLYEFAPEEACGVKGCRVEFVSRALVGGLLEGCEVEGVCEHCELDARAIERAELRGAVRRVLLEPLRFGAEVEMVVKTFLVRIKELSPELVRCATGESLGALLGYKAGARRAGVSAHTRRVLNTPVESSTGHAARFGRQKTPGMRGRCAAAQKGNGNRAAGAMRALVGRVVCAVEGGDIL